MTTFNDLGLSQHILDSLGRLDYKTPTPIQTAAIPLVLAGKDLIGLAQTGTGKTAAFGLPLIDGLMASHNRREARRTHALILAPTRELVNQIAANLKNFVKKTPLSVGIVVGGVSINSQIRMLERGLDILVATPGRMLDLIERKALFLDKTHRLVLDEADQMLDLGFIHDLRRIVRLVPKERQTLLFSATMPNQISELAGSYLTNPERVEVTPPGRTADRVEQCVHFVADKGGKVPLLISELKRHPDGLSLVFGRTKHGSEKLMKQLVAAGFKAASIHGNKSQNQRERALKAFRDGEIRVLVATDVAARGIDIPGVSHVYNFELPEVPDAYVHRIGRTARAGRDGIAVAFCAPDEAHLLRDIERQIGIEITVASGERPTRIEAPKRKSNGRGGPRRGNGNGPKPAAKAGQKRSRPGSAQQRSRRPQGGERRRQSA